MPGRPRSASGTASIAARSPGASYVGQSRSPIRRLLTTVRCRPRSIAPSSVPMATSTTSPCLRYLGFWACRWKKSFHFSAGGRNAAMISTGFGGALRAVPSGVPVRSRSPGSSRWNRLSACSASQRGVDHVAVDHRVLAQLAVDPQAQAQVAEPLELVVVEQDQRRSDRREGRVGLGLEELGLRQLHVAGGDVVGHHQAGHERGPVVGGDLRAHRQLPADHQADLDLVVQEAHVIGADDVVERAADRARRLAEERQRDGVRVEPGVLHVAGEVGHLRDHPAGCRHRGHQVEGGRVDGLLARPGGLDLLGLGEQLAGGRGVGVDAGGAARGCGPTRRRRCAGW